MWLLCRQSITKFLALEIAQSILESTMTEENIEQPIPVQESIPEPVAPTEVTVEKPAPKKRGRKPKVVAPPAPPVEAPKPRRRRNVVRMSRDERAFGAAVSSAEKERAKCIEELSRIMEQWDVKQARLKSLDWKISALKGNTDKSAIAGMQLQSYNQPQAPGYPIPPQYPQPPAYPNPSAPSYMPPGMRTPALPVVPGAGGGAVDTGQELAVNDDEDQFLKGNGGVIGGSGWK